MGPIVEAAKSEYAGRVDFRTYNITDPRAAQAEVELFQQLGGTGVPEYYFVDSSGKLVERVVGGMPEKDLMARLETLK